MCWECSQCLGHTGFTPAHGVCAFPVYTAQAPSYSAGELSKACPGLCALPRSKPLMFRFSGTPQKDRLSWVCVLCPSQVWAAQVTKCLVSTLSPGGPCVLSPPRSQPLDFLGAVGALSQVCCVSPLGSWSLTVTLLADFNCPGSQEDLISNWEPAHSLVKDAISEVEIAPCLLALAATHLPLCLRWGGAGSPQPASSPLVFIQSFVLWLCKVVPYGFSQETSLSLFFPL